MRTGDKVITAGGIHGLVTNVKKESVTVKVDNNTRIEFEKGRIARIIGICALLSLIGLMTYFHLNCL